MNGRSRLDNLYVKSLPLFFTLAVSQAALAQDAGAPAVVDKQTTTQGPTAQGLQDRTERPLERRPAPPLVATSAFPVATLEHGALDRCEGGWESAYTKVRTATVKIENAKGTATGFLYGDGRHIITSYHAIDDNRDIVVTFANGEKTDAKVVDVDEDDDLAILMAPNARPPSAALNARALPISPGLPIGVVGHPFATFGERFEDLKGLLVWSLTTGVVSAANARLIQYDAPTNMGNSGGPLFDCSGALVGMVSHSMVQANGIHFATAAQHVQRLFERAASGNGRTYAGKWRFEHLSLNLLFGFHEDERPVGLGLGLDFSYADRFVIHGDIGSLLDDNDNLVHRWERRRIQGALTAGYRLVLSSKPAFPMKLTLGGGGFAQHVKRTDEWGLAVASNCGAAECPVTMFTRVDRSSEFRILPVLTADLLMMNHLRLAYSFTASLADLKEGQHHTLAVGVVF